MNGAQLLGIALCLVVVAEIYCCIKAWPKKRLGYELKKFINGLRPMVHFIGAMYILLIGIIPLKSIGEFVGVAHPSSKFGEIIINLTPIAWIFILLVIIAWVVSKGMQEWIKYNNKELEWRKDEQVKFRSKLPTMLKWVAGKVE